MAKAVLIRSGGLGDFVLILPLFKLLTDIYNDLTLITRRAYWQMIRDEGFCANYVDVDSRDFCSMFSIPSLTMRRLFKGAMVYSFLPDPDGILSETALSLGAAGFKTLEPRPLGPPHFAIRMFRDAGLEPPERIFKTPVLGFRETGSDLWIHPGSGSRLKNAPISWFARIAARWLEDNSGGVVISIGEADMHILQPAREAFKNLPARFEVLPTLSELKEGLRSRAAFYVGNDSGVSHLAAALGIPVSVCFVSTDPAVWAPLGKDVSVIEMAEGSKGLSPPCTGAAVL